MLGSFNQSPAIICNTILPIPAPEKAIPNARPLLCLNQAFISVGTPIADIVAVPT